MPARYMSAAAMLSLAAPSAARISPVNTAPACCATPAVQGVLVNGGNFGGHGQGPAFRSLTPSRGACPRRPGQDTAAVRPCRPGWASAGLSASLSPPGEPGMNGAGRKRGGLPAPATVTAGPPHRRPAPGRGAAVLLVIMLASVLTVITGAPLEPCTGPEGVAGSLTCAADKGRTSGDGRTRPPCTTRRTL